MNISQSKFRPLGFLAVMALAVVLISAVVAVEADAARGGGGKSHKGGGTTASLTITPDPVPLGSATITISGSGFAANQDLILNTGVGPQPWVTTDGSGSFSLDYSPSGTFWLAGPAYVQAIRPTDMAVLATVFYTVE